MYGLRNSGSRLASAFHKGVGWGLLVLALCCSSPLLAQQRDLLFDRQSSFASENRVALVIGNATYPAMPLKNPVNDARAMTKKLKSLGFDVVLKENVTAKQIGKTFTEFRSRLRPGSIAVFFYAGHGLQFKGSNYLPAVDADISSEFDVPQQSFELSKMLEMLEDAKTGMNLIFLDACRNNPFARAFRSASTGLARVAAPSGTLISYATRPGSVAADGEGANGLYTTHLLQQMDMSGLPIETVLKRVVTGVKRDSKGAQEPWMEGSIEGEFFFNPANMADEGKSSASVARAEADMREVAEKELEMKKAALATEQQKLQALREANERLAVEKREAERRTEEEREKVRRLAEQQEGLRLAGEKREAERRVLEERENSRRIAEQKEADRLEAERRNAEAEKKGRPEIVNKPLPTQIAMVSSGSSTKAIEESLHKVSDLPASYASQTLPKHLKGTWDKDGKQDSGQAEIYISEIQAGKVKGETVIWSNACGGLRHPIVGSFDGSQLDLLIKSGNVRCNDSQIRLRLSDGGKYIGIINLGSGDRASKFYRGSDVSGDIPDTTRVNTKLIGK
jgi:uncharacterized caspase-like protein